MESASQFGSSVIIYFKLCIGLSLTTSEYIIQNHVSMNSQPQLHVSGLCEETGEPGVNLSTHGRWCKRHAEITAI